MSRSIRLIVIHCAATPDERTLFAGTPGTPGFVDPAMEIDRWHATSGFRRDSYWRGRQNAHLTAIGYHFVIARNGALFTGRHVDEVGAHAVGWNAPSLGICLVGSARFTAEQWQQLAYTVSALAQKHELPLAPPEPVLRDGRRYLARPGVCGHRELPEVAKDCPGFSVSAWLAGGLQPLAEATA